MRVFHQDGSCLARTSVFVLGSDGSGWGACAGLSSEEGLCHAIIRPDPTQRCPDAPVRRSTFKPLERSSHRDNGRSTRATRPTWTSGTTGAARQHRAGAAITLLHTCGRIASPHSMRPFSFPTDHHPTRRCPRCVGAHLLDPHFRWIHEIF
jgi:hypothetical protein